MEVIELSLFFIPVLPLCKKIFRLSLYCRSRSGFPHIIMTFYALRYPQILCTSRISDSDLANSLIQKGPKFISVLKPLHTQMQKDQEKKNHQNKKPQQHQVVGNQLSKEHLVKITFNFEEDDTVGVLER